MAMNNINEFIQKVDLKIGGLPKHIRHLLIDLADYNHSRWKDRQHTAGYDIVMKTGFTTNQNAWIDSLKKSYEKEAGHGPVEVEKVVPEKKITIKKPAEYEIRELKKFLENHETEIAMDLEDFGILFDWFTKLFDRVPEHRVHMDRRDKDESQDEDAKSCVNCGNAGRYGACDQIKVLSRNVPKARKYCTKWRAKARERKSMPVKECKLSPHNATADVHDCCEYWCDFCGCTYDRFQKENHGEPTKEELVIENRELQLIIENHATVANDAVERLKTMFNLHRALDPKTEPECPVQKTPFEYDDSGIKEMIRKEKEFIAARKERQTSEENRDEFITFEKSLKRREISKETQTRKANRMKRDELPIILCRFCRKPMQVLGGENDNTFIIHCLEKDCMKQKSINVYHTHRKDGSLGVAEEILLKQYEDDKWCHKKDMKEFIDTIWSMWIEYL
jgi:hypothetical protein